MTCEEARERLPWLWNGSLPEPEREQLNAHLETCPACWKEFEQTQWLGEAVAASAPAERPARTVPVWFAIAAMLAAVGLGIGWWREASVAAPMAAVASVRVADLIPTGWNQRGSAPGSVTVLPAMKPVLLLLTPPPVEGFEPGRLELLAGERVLWREANPVRQAEGDFTVLLPAGLAAGEYELQFHARQGTNPAAVYKLSVRP
ncbi:MAG: hypothetical protein FJW39_05195 [Acidobacteria bacterium]|nr:hypothetical protein [Acidobacteriota bacterium]